MLVPAHTNFLGIILQARESGQCVLSLGPAGRPADKRHLGMLMGSCAQGEAGSFNF